MTLKLTLFFFLLATPALAQTATSRKAMAAAVAEVTQSKPRVAIAPKKRAAASVDLGDAILWSGLVHDEISTAAKLSQGCREAGLVKNRAAAAAGKVGFAVGWKIAERKNPKFAQSAGNKVFKSVAGAVFHAAAGWNWRQDCRGRK